MHEAPILWGLGRADISSLTCQAQRSFTNSNPWPLGHKVATLPLRQGSPTLCKQYQWPKLIHWEIIWVLFFFVKALVLTSRCWNLQSFFFTCRIFVNQPREMSSLIRVFTYLHSWEKIYLIWPFLRNFYQAKKTLSFCFVLVILFVFFFTVHNFGIVLINLSKPLKKIFVSKMILEHS